MTKIGHFLVLKSGQVEKRCQINVQTAAGETFIISIKEITSVE